jgi:hypothetical protein
MMSVGSFETSATTYPAKKRHIPKDRRHRIDLSFVSSLNFEIFNFKFRQIALINLTALMDTELIKNSFLILLSWSPVPCCARGKEDKSRVSFRKLEERRVVSSVDTSCCASKINT